MREAGFVQEAPGRIRDGTLIRVAALGPPRGTEAGKREKLWPPPGHGCLELLLLEEGAAGSGRGGLCSQSFEKHCPIHALNPGQTTSSVARQAHPSSWGRWGAKALPGCFQSSPREKVSGTRVSQWTQFLLTAWRNPVDLLPPSISWQIG